MECKSALSIVFLAACAAFPCHADDTPYAVIDWPSRFNPDVVTLGNDEFLLLTDQAMQVWNARTKAMIPASGWPRHTGIGAQWGRLAGGTVVAGKSHTDELDLPFASLMWWNPQSHRFAPPLVLPPGSNVRRLVPIDGQQVLACLATNWPRKESDPETNRAVLLRVSGGALQMDAAAPAPAVRAALLAAGVRGTIDGVPLGEAPREPGTAPVTFDTASCSWKVGQLPRQANQKRPSEFRPYYLSKGAVVIVTDDNTPALLWDKTTRAWRALPPASDIGMQGNYGPTDPLVRGRDSYVEQFDPATMRWALNGKRLPDSYMPILAPMSNGQTVVFLREQGRVMLLPPFPPPR
jgi:hypothetical protein